MKVLTGRVTRNARASAVLNAGWRTSPGTTTLRAAPCRVSAVAKPLSRAARSRSAPSRAGTTTGRPSRTSIRASTGCVPIVITGASACISTSASTSGTSRPSCTRTVRARPNSRGGATTRCPAIVSDDGGGHRRLSEAAEHPVDLVCRHDRLRLPQGQLLRTLVEEPRDQHPTGGRPVDDEPGPTRDSERLAVGERDGPVDGRLRDAGGERVESLLHLHLVDGDHGPVVAASTDELPDALR